MRLCLIPRRVTRNRKQFIAIRRCCQALISWWRSIPGLKTTGEGGPRPLGWGRRKNGREPGGGSHNEALMRGEQTAFVEAREEAAAARALPRSLPSPAPSTANPLGAGCGHRPGAHCGKSWARDTLAGSEPRQETQHLHATMQTRSLPSRQYA